MNKDITKELELTLKFLGTGRLDIKSDDHKLCSGVLLEHGSERILLDCGDKDFDLSKISPKAILLTHSHPDHTAGFLKSINERLEDIKDIQIYIPKQSGIIFMKGNVEIPTNKMDSNKDFQVGSFTFNFANVLHASNIETSAIVCKIGGVFKLTYAPDILWYGTRNRELMFKDLDYYIGDGSSLIDNIKRDDGFGGETGHASIKTQLEWLKNNNFKGTAFFTHFGRELINLDRKTLERQIKEIGKEFGIDSHIAYDGKEIRLGEVEQDSELQKESDELDDAVREVLKQIKDKASIIKESKPSETEILELEIKKKKLELLNKWLEANKT